MNTGHTPEATLGRKKRKKKRKKKNDLYREIEHTLGELSLSMVRALIPYNREERSVC